MHEEQLISQLSTFDKYGLPALIIAVLLYFIFKGVKAIFEFYDKHLTAIVESGERKDALWRDSFDKNTEVLRTLSAQLGGDRNE